MKTSEIADFIAGELLGRPDIEIVGIGSVESASVGELAFLEKNLPVSTNASCVLVPNNYAYQMTACLISVENPKLAFAQVATLLHPPKVRPAELHRSAVMSETAKLGEDVFVGAFVCIGDGSNVGDGTQLRSGAKVGDNVTIGKKCILHPNVFIEDGCTIGDNVILHTGVVIGADGFGYVRSENEHIKFPQVGT